MSRDCCVGLPHDATGVFAVCDCGISCLYSRTILKENKAYLARLLRKPEELFCQAVDGDIVTAGGFESPALVICSDHDSDIVSATHKADTHILFHAEAA